MRSYITRVQYSPVRKVTRSKMEFGALLKLASCVMPPPPLTNGTTGATTSPNNATPRTPKQITATRRNNRTLAMPGTERYNARKSTRRLRRDRAIRTMRRIRASRRTRITLKLKRASKDGEIHESVPTTLPSKPTTTNTKSNTFHFERKYCRMPSASNLIAASSANKAVNTQSSAKCIVSNARVDGNTRAMISIMLSAMRV
mmetsp:Transcript_9242/g.19533  ORF Transcript_9242/g.19533 Transcript_9242/m.19533 type:complete len:201 (-) Transcript_9242:180-782(-)